MSVTTDFELIDQSHAQLSLAKKYRADFINAYDHLKRLDQNIQHDKDTTEFNAIPADAKLALRDCWLETQSFLAKLEASTAIMQMLNRTLPEIPEP